MTYNFDARIAEMYGVDEAVFIHNLYWWIRKNEANGRHYYDGRNWTYNSMQAFLEFFPFWTVAKVRRIIQKLRDNGAIYVGNYNQRGFDRTRWYALSETIICIYANRQMDVSKMTNGCVENDRPIPDSKPDNKHIYTVDDDFDAFWNSYPKKVGKQDALKAVKKIKPDGILLGQIMKSLDAHKLKSEWLKDDGQFIPHASTWLNGKRWEDEVKTGRYKSLD